MELRRIGALVLGVGLLAAVSLVLLGVLLGQHGMVDALGFVSAAVAVLVGVPMWSIGWLLSRRQGS
jgi:hypothetical protein